MDVVSILQEIGLSSGETSVYLALLKINSAPVSKIKEETTLHRTAIYDFINRLLNKGLVNYVVMNNVRHYKATDPIKLLDFLKEKEQQVQDILPSLQKMSKLEKDEVKVEVYKGKEGVKTFMNDVARQKQELLAFGIDESRFVDLLGSFMDQYFRKEKEGGYNERVLTFEGAPFVYPYETAEYRFISKQYFNPTPTYVYANKVAILIWEPLMMIMIENASLADSYRKYFEILWSIAKKDNS